jgi:hypothetical protein
VTTAAEVVEGREETGSPSRLSWDGDVAVTLAGLACGLVVGVTLGLLLAPRSGHDSRAWIAQQARSIVRRRGIRGLVEAWQTCVRPRR